MSETVADFLTRIHIPFATEYADAFAARGVADMRVMRTLSGWQLMEHGMINVQHRRAVLAALAVEP